MLIRQDFCDSELPPRLFLEQIMNDLSRTYCFLWDIKGDTHTVSFTWKELHKFYNKNAFRSNIRKLNREGLLSYEESDDGISIELVGWDEIAG